jgi:hypothetical protein
MGLNESAGYVMATGVIAEHAGLRPEPFFLGLAYAGLGLGLSALLVRETRGHATLEANTHPEASGGLGEVLSMGQVFRLTSLGERTMSACSQAGLVNNLNDAMAWGLFPLLYAGRGLSVGAIGILAAYPAVWGFGQLLTGALSDRLGRQVADRRWHVGPGGGHRDHRRPVGLRGVGPRIGAAGRGDSHGRPELAGGDRRRRPPVVAGVGGWRLPVLA